MDLKINNRIKHNLTMAFSVRQIMDILCLNSIFVLFSDHHIPLSRDDDSGGKADKGDSGGGLTFVRDGTHYVYGLVSTKIGDDKKVRLFTNLMDDSHWSWLLRELRNFQVKLGKLTDT